MSVCANCEKAKVYLGKNARGNPYHYVKCLAGFWTRRISLTHHLLRGGRDCPDYVSMGDEDLNRFLASLPADKVDYENRWLGME